MKTSSALVAEESWRSQDSLEMPKDELLNHSCIKHLRSLV